MDNNKVATKYEAVDGILFDTYKECIEYNNKPRIWLVSSRYGGNYAFVDKEMAFKEAKKLSEKAIIYAYSVSSVIVNMEEFTTIQEKITSTKSNDSWYRKLRGLF